MRVFHVLNKGKKSSVMVAFCFLHKINLPKNQHFRNYFKIICKYICKYKY